jgi:CBS domain-containing protein
MQKLTAKDIMTTEIVTIPEDMLVSRLATLLTKKMISGVPVVDKEGNLIGVVSLSDIVQSSVQINAKDSKSPKTDFYSYAWGNEWNEDEWDGFHYENEDGMQVQDIMTPVVISVTEETSIVQMAETMLAGRVHRLIVTKNKKVVGIVTTMDMLKIITKIYPKQQSEDEWQVRINEK